MKRLQTPSQLSRTSFGGTKGIADGVITLSTILLMEGNSTVISSLDSALRKQVRKQNNKGYQIEQLPSLHRFYFFCMQYLQQDQSTLSINKNNTAWCLCFHIFPPVLIKGSPSRRSFLSTCTFSIFPKRAPSSARKERKNLCQSFIYLGTRE